MTRGMINLVPGQYMGNWWSKRHDWKMGFAKEFATEQRMDTISQCLDNVEQTHLDFHLGWQEILLGPDFKEKTVGFVRAMNALSTIPSNLKCFTNSEDDV